MNIEQFENMAKKHVPTSGPALDHDDIWQQIEPRLKKKKKRRAIVFWLWGLGIGALGLWLWQLMPNHAPHSLPEAQNPPKLSASAKTLTIQTTEAPTLSEQNERPQNAEVNKGKKGTSPIALGLSQVPFEAATPLAKGQNIDSQGSGAVEEENTVAPIPVIDEGTGSTSPDLGELVSETEPALQPKASVPLEQAAEKRQTTSKTEIERSAKTTAEKKPRTTPVKHAKAKGYANIWASPVLAFKILGSRQGADGVGALMDKRRESESRLEAFAVGARYIYPTKNGLIFVGGLEYQRLNERFELSYQSKETKTVNGLLSQTVNELGLVVKEEYGDKTVTITKEYLNRSYSSYQFLSLPIGMGVQHKNRRSMWNLSGGLSLNLMSRFDGTIYNRFGVPVKFSSAGNDEVFRRYAGLGAWAAFDYARPLSKRLYWHAGIQANGPFGSLTTDKYPMTQHMLQVGARGGLLFDLAKPKVVKRRGGIHK